MAHLMILACSILSGYVSWFLADRRARKGRSLLAGVVSAFILYILAWTMLDSVMDVDDGSLGMLFAFGFPLLILIFAGAAWMGALLANRTES